MFELLRSYSTIVQSSGKEIATEVSVLFLLQEQHLIWGKSIDGVFCSSPEKNSEGRKILEGKITWDFLRNE